MVTAAENKVLTEVGPGTRMGALLRRYWHPVAAVDQLKAKWTHRVRILGEDLVLYRDRNGKYGLVGEHCPHRGASLLYGIPTEEGIRCPYHGWHFDSNGNCLQQPFESGKSALLKKKATDAYPVEEMGGLLFAYLGPTPAPLLPRFEAFVWPGAIRTIGCYVIACNWLQCMDNSADPVHTEWLHGRLHEFRNEKDGVTTSIAQEHDRIAFDEFEYGLIKRRLYKGQRETAEDWVVGHPIVFPNALLIGSDGGAWKAHNFQIRVPLDDTHTANYWYQAFIPPEGKTVPDALKTEIPPYYEPRLKTPEGAWDMDYIDAQDFMAWETQGEISDRTRENLGASDKGVIAYRKMLMRELEKVESGADPIGVNRDPQANEPIRLPLEKGKDMYEDGFASFTRRLAVRFSPIYPDLVDLFTKSAREAAE